MTIKPFVVTPEQYAPALNIVGEQMSAASFVAHARAFVMLLAPDATCP